MLVYGIVHEFQLSVCVCIYIYIYIYLRNTYFFASSLIRFQYLHSEVLLERRLRSLFRH